MKRILLLTVIALCGCAHHSGPRYQSLAHQAESHMRYEFRLADAYERATMHDDSARSLGMAHIWKRHANWWRAELNQEPIP